MTKILLYKYCYESLLLYSIILLYLPESPFAVFRIIHPYVCIYVCMYIGICFTFSCPQRPFLVFLRWCQHVCMCVSDHNNTQTLFSIELIFGERVIDHWNQNCINFRSNRTKALISKQFWNRFSTLSGSKRTSKYFIF